MYSMIVVSHPLKDSLVVNAATHVYTVLHNAKRPVAFYYLDGIQYDPILSEEEFKRKISFEEQTLEFQKKLLNITQLVLFFPDWWSMPPARMVGWLQRVFSSGVAFSYERDVEVPSIEKKLNTLSIVYAVTSNEKCAESIEMSLDIFHKRLKYYTGIKKKEYCILHDVKNSTYNQRSQWISQCIETIQRIYL